MAENKTPEFEPPQVRGVGSGARVRSILFPSSSVGYKSPANVRSVKLAMSPTRVLLDELGRGDELKDDFDRFAVEIYAGYERAYQVRVRRASWHSN